MKKIILLISFLIPVILHAQNTTRLGSLIPKFVPLSPNSSTFEKYGNYEVSMFTGLPQINIPLYTISVGDLQVPISLSYHASGIKVNDIGSWVGMGWNLNANYAISRQIRGLPDERPNNYLSGARPIRTAMNLNSQIDISYMADVNRGRGDYEPDLFTYTIPGKNGRFVFNHKDGFKPVIVPYAPIEINRTPIGFPSGMNMDILDENGTRYNFTEQESPVIGSDFPGATSTWLISNITSANIFNQINFSYSSVTSSQSDIVDYQTIEDYGRILDPDPNSTQTWYNQYGSSSISKTLEITTKEKYLSQITFRTGRVEFYTQSRADRANTSSPRLSSIKIFDNNNKVIRSIKFNHSYFIKGGDASTMRLRLDNIQISDGVKIQQYSFNYNTTQELPSRLSRARDYWGYYNGQDYNTTLIPGMNVDYILTSGGSTTYHIGGTAIGRESNPDAMQACVLNKITYPTGGFTEFTYETNKYKTYGNEIKYAGGLRVASIKSFDSETANPMVKTYVYGTVQNPTDGFGENNFYLTDNFFKTEQTDRYFFGNVPGPTSTGNCYGTAAKRVRTYISSPLLSLDPADGSPVLYPVVTEFQGTQTSNVGKSQYTFRFTRDQFNSFSSVVSSKPQITSFQFARGQLEKKVDYWEGDGFNVPVRSIENEYEAFPRNNVEDLGFVAYKINNNIYADGHTEPDIGITSCFNNYTDKYSYAYGNYGILTGDDKLVKSIEKSYSGYLTTTTTTTHQYNNLQHLQLSKTEVITSKTNEKHITEIKYPDDFIASNATGSIWQGLANLKSKHIIKPIEKSIYKSPLSSTEKRLLSSQLYTYNSAKPVLDAIYELEPVQPLLDFNSASVSGETFSYDNRYQKKITFDSYDRDFNILQQHLQHGINTSYVWDGDFNLLAEVKNAAQSDVFYQNFEDSSQSGVSGYDDSKTGHYSKINGFNISLPQVGMAPLRNGKYMLSYWEKLNGNWNYVKINNIEVNSGQYIIKILGQVDEVRFHPRDALMTTYGYDTLVGLTSITDTRGVTTYYEYDQFQRLKSVRDQNKNLVKAIDYNYQH